MKVLFVCSGNSNAENYSFENHHPFVYDQYNSLIKKGIEVNVFLIKGNGIIGYLTNLPTLSKKIKSEKYDLIHAHFGLSGMLATLQRKCPVVITFQGCDINRIELMCISKFAMKLSSHNIFVSRMLAKKAKAKENYSIIPYGVDLGNTFKPLKKDDCRKALKLNCNDKIVLFSSSFDRVEKNYELARKSIEMVGDLTLVELSKGYKRCDVNKLFNASDLLLMTSLREGSPQVIKEAMACNCPIVSTDVGDVKEVIGSTEGCYITSFDPKDVAEKIKKALNFGERTSGRKRVKNFKMNNVAEKIFDLYKRILSSS